MKMKRPTLATIKSFIRKNSDKLHIKISGSFDGMCDGFNDHRNCDFRPVKNIKWPNENTSSLYLDCFPILGSYGSGNSFMHYEDDNFIGYIVSNCCAFFKIAIPNK